MDFYCNSCNIGFQWIWNNKIWRLWIRWNDEHDVRKLRKRHDVFRLDLRNPHNCGTCVPDNLVMAANTKSEKKIMVNKEKINGKGYYQCNICKFYYKEKSFAEKCERWCKEHKRCNLKITKYAIKPKRR